MDVCVRDVDQVLGASRASLIGMSRGSPPLAGVQGCAPFRRCLECCIPARPTSVSSISTTASQGHLGSTVRWRHNPDRLCWQRMFRDRKRVYVLGFLIIVGFQLLGIGLHRLGVPLPGSVLGLLLFTFALAIEAVKLKWVERTATFIVHHMSLLFIPIMAGLPGVSAELRRDGLALMASTVISLLAVLLTTGGLAHSLLRDPARLPSCEGASE